MLDIDIYVYIYILLYVYTYIYGTPFKTSKKTEGGYLRSMLRLVVNVDSRDVALVNQEDNQVTERN